MEQGIRPGTGATRERTTRMANNIKAREWLKVLKVVVYRKTLTLLVSEENLLHGKHTEWLPQMNHCTRQLVPLHHHVFPSLLSPQEVT